MTSILLLNSKGLFSKEYKLKQKTSSKCLHIPYLNTDNEIMTVPKDYIIATPKLINAEEFETYDFIGYPLTNTISSDTLSKLETINNYSDNKLTNTLEKWTSRYNISDPNNTNRYCPSDRTNKLLFIYTILSYASYADNTIIDDESCTLEIPFNNVTAKKLNASGDPDCYIDYFKNTKCIKDNFKQIMDDNNLNDCSIDNIYIINEYNDKLQAIGGYLKLPNTLIDNHMKNDVPDIEDKGIPFLFFRGTNNFSNVLSDINCGAAFSAMKATIELSGNISWSSDKNIQLGDCKYKADLGESGSMNVKVGEGMYKSNCSVFGKHTTMGFELWWNSSLKKVIEQTRPVIIGGHSLGGAYAQYSTYLTNLELSGENNYHVNTLYTYNSPRAGNFAFATVLNETVPNNYRFINRGYEQMLGKSGDATSFGDIVSCLPYLSGSLSTRASFDRQPFHTGNLYINALKVDTKKIGILKTVTPYHIFSMGLYYIPWNNINSNNLDENCDILKNESISITKNKIAHSFHMLGKPVDDKCEEIPDTYPQAGVRDFLTVSKSIKKDLMDKYSCIDPIE